MWHNNKTDYIANLEEGYHEHKEIIILDETLNSCIDEFKKGIETIVNNKFVETADGEGLSRYEKIYALTPLSRDDVKARRRKLLANYRDKPPVNDITLKAICETYLGVKVDIKRHKQPYYFEIHYRNYKELIDAVPLEKRLRELIPANIDFKVLYAFIKWGEINTQTWREIKTRTWNDVLIGGA